MERHQTGQMEQLVEVKTGGLEVLHQSRVQSVSRHACFKGMVILAKGMGLVLFTLLAIVILQYFIFTSSCNQNTPPLNDTAITCRPKKSDEPGTYDIFTAKQSTTYLILGWVKLQDITNEEITLTQSDQRGNLRTIEMMTGDKTVIFFNTSVTLVENFKISLHVMSAYNDSLFLVHEM